MPPTHAALTQSLASWLETLPYVAPELCMLGGLLLVAVADMAFGKKWHYAAAAMGHFVLLAALCIWVFTSPGPQSGSIWLGSGALVQDGLGWLARGLCMGIGLLGLAVAGAHNSPMGPRGAPAEYVYLYLAMALGLSTMVWAGHLLLLYLAAELVSIPAYVLVAYRRADRRASEASLKYVVFGAASSAILLYGVSLLYGLTGSLQFAHPHFAEALAASPPAAVAVAVGMVAVGMLFKVGAVPFHFWAPDAYQAGTPTLVAFLSTAPKAAGLVVLVRLAWVAHEAGYGNEAALGIGAIALLTMTVGNLAALWQTDFQRLLAYSGIAQSGFMLLGVAAYATEGGVAGLLFYLFVYSLLGMASFLLACVLGDAAGTPDMRQWPSRISLGTGASVGLVAVMLGLVGLPPSAGFIAKLNVFLPLWEVYAKTNNMFWVISLGVAVANTVLSLVFYFRAPSAMLLKKPLTDGPQRKQAVMNYRQKIVLAVLVVPTVVLGVWGFDKVLNGLNAILHN